MLLVAHTVREDLEHGHSSRWFASSPLEKLPRRREKAMKTKMVSYTLETLPELTEAQIAHLEALAARPDSEIDSATFPN